MKKNLSKILGVGLTIAVLTSLMVVATPVSGGTLSWSAETDIPKTDTHVLESGSDVLDIAVAYDDATIYAVSPGNEAIQLVVTTAPVGAGAVASVAISYTDQDGNAGGPLAAITSINATALVGTTAAVTLTAPDTGIRNITLVTFSGWTGATAGKIEVQGKTTETAYATITMATGVGTVAYPAIPKSVYKSSNGGSTWEVLDNPGSVNATVSRVAVAPDDASTIAIVADNNEVYASTDGGVKWSGLTGLTITAINDIAISPASGGKYYIAVAGNKGVGTPSIQYFDLGSSVPVWTDATAWGGLNANTDILAVAFSPAFASDKVMVAVTENATPAVSFEIASHGSKKWNTSGGFASYPVNILNVASPLSASIALAPTYLGADEAERIAFVGVAATATTGTLTRLKDTTAKELKSSDIHSIDYDGTNLIAGDYGSTAVYRSADPLSSDWTVSTTSTYQKPGGTSMAVVAWAGTNVVAGTNGNESAFAISKDNGKTFNDVSLIDTTQTNIRDVAVSGDGNKVYTLTDDGTDLSLWRKAATWERILSLPGTTYILRIAPQDAARVYLVDTTSTTMYYSSDSGEASWQLRAMINTPTDFEVESAEVAYALRSNGYVEKTTNAGFIWATGKSTKLGNGATIVSLGEDKLIVGGTAGYVSYSTDGGSTWTKIDKAAFSSGNIQVTASTLAGGDFIYAGTSTANQNIVRWQIGTSTKWDDIINGTLDGSCYGLALSGGTLYAATNNGTDSTLYRTLSPSTADDTTTWSSTTSTADFTLTPRALKPSAGKLWMVDTTSNALYSFSDTVSTTAVTVTAPADKAIIPVNPVTGFAQDVAYNWSRASKATAYDLDIALDSGFKQKVRGETNLSSTADTVVFILGPYSSIPASKGGSATTLQYMAGTTYYWRVRASAPIYSPWSATRSFTVAAIVEPVMFDVVSPAVGATDVSITPTFVWNDMEGATGYEMVVSEDPTYAIIEWGHATDNPWYRTTADEALAYSTTYYWRARAILGASVAPGGSGAPTAGARSAWASGILTTAAEPKVAAPTVIIQKEPAPPAEVKIVEVPGKTEVVQQAIPDVLLWAIIAIGAALVIALIVLIVRTRRVA